MKPRTHRLCSSQQYCKVDGIRHVLTVTSRSALQDFQASVTDIAQATHLASQNERPLYLSYIYNTSNTYIFSNDFKLLFPFNPVIQLVFFHLGLRNPFIHVRATSIYIYTWSVQRFPSSVRYLHHAVCMRLGSSKKRPAYLYCNLMGIYSVILIWTKNVIEITWLQLFLIV